MNKTIDPIESMIRQYWDRRDYRDKDEWITSMDVHKLTNKRHDHVLRDIDNLVDKLLKDSRRNSIPENIDEVLRVKLNEHDKLINDNVPQPWGTFVEKERKTSGGTYRYYAMTKKGFLMLINSYDPFWGELLVKFYLRVTEYMNDRDIELDREVLGLPPSDRHVSFHLVANSLETLHDDHHKNQMFLWRMEDRAETPLEKFELMDDIQKAEDKYKRIARAYVKELADMYDMKVILKGDSNE